MPENETVFEVTDLPEAPVQETPGRKFNIKKMAIIAAVTTVAVGAVVLIAKYATKDTKNESEHIEITYDSTPAVTPDAA